MPDSLLNFWVVPYLNQFLEDLSKVGYNSTDRKLNHFTAVNIKNEEQQVKSNQERYVLLDFSAAGCAPCLNGIDKLVEFDAEYNDKLEIVMLWDSMEHKKWMGYAKKHQAKITFTNLLDSSGAIFRVFDIKYYPTYMLFDKQGDLLKKWSKLPKDIGKYLR